MNKYPNVLDARKKLYNIDNSYKIIFTKKKKLTNIFVKKKPNQKKGLSETQFYSYTLINYSHICKFLLKIIKRYAMIWLQRRSKHCCI